MKEYTAKEYHTIQSRFEELKKESGGQCKPAFIKLQEIFPGYSEKYLNRIIYDKKLKIKMAESLILN